MAKIYPFPAVRPTPEFADKVAALPYDVMNSQEARELVQGNPFSFLHVDKAEIDLDPKVDPYSEAVYQKAKSNLEELIAKGILKQDSQANYYIYQLDMDGQQQTGLVAGSSVQDYQKGIIKKHEFTRADKEKDRIQHVDTTNAQTGPIFLAYRDQKEIHQLMEDWKAEHDPVYDFTAEDGIRHTAWVIDDLETQLLLTALFHKVPYTYIADGHHRTASAAAVCERRQKEFPQAEETAPFQYFLSVLFPASQLRIFDYNRVVKDLAGQSQDEFLEKIKGAGISVTPVESPYQPKKAREFGMYLAGNWYHLELTQRTEEPLSPVDQLDVSLLQHKILQPLLHIGDPRVDERIDFIGGIRGLKELEQRVDSGNWAVAFSMYPTSIEEVMEIADNHLVMPPKSTWFEPKLRSGLFINLLDYP